MVAGQQAPRRRHAQDGTGVAPLPAAAAVPRRLTKALCRGDRGAGLAVSEDDDTKRQRRQGELPPKQRWRAAHAATLMGRPQQRPLHTQHEAPSGTRMAPAARLPRLAQSSSTLQELLC